MKKISLKALASILIVLVFLLAISTFIPQNRPWGWYPDYLPLGMGYLVLALQLGHFYNSFLNIVLWLIFSFFCLLYSFIEFKRDKIKSMAILMLAILIGIFFYNQSFNHRFFMELREGSAIRLDSVLTGTSPQYQRILKLEQFEIQNHPGSERPAAYISHLTLDEEQVQLKVNHPICIGSYRFYQNDYRQLEEISLQWGDQSMLKEWGDSINLRDHVIQLVEFEPVRKQIRLQLDGRFLAIEEGSSILLDSLPLLINLTSQGYVSVLEVVEISGIGFLFWISFISIIMTGLIVIRFVKEN